MKKKITTLLAILFLLAIHTAKAQDSTVTRYPVVVSFQSICCGVPSDSTVVSYISAFKRKNKLTGIEATQIGPMGKEGEYYLAFSLKELNKKQMKSFIAGLKKVKKQPDETGEISFMENYSLQDKPKPRRATKRKIVY